MSASPPWENTAGQRSIIAMASDVTQRKQAEMVQHRKGQTPFHFRRHARSGLCCRQGLHHRVLTPQASANLVFTKASPATSFSMSARTYALGAQWTKSRGRILFRNGPPEPWRSHEPRMQPSTIQTETVSKARFPRCNGPQTYSRKNCSFNRSFSIPKRPGKLHPFSQSNGQSG